MDLVFSYARAILRQVKTLDLVKSTLLSMLSLLDWDAPDLEALEGVVGNT